MSENNKFNSIAEENLEKIVGGAAASVTQDELQKKLEDAMDLYNSNKSNIPDPDKRTLDGLFNDAYEGCKAGLTAAQLHDTLYSIVTTCNTLYKRSYYRFLREIITSLTSLL